MLYGTRLGCRNSFSKETPASSELYLRRIEEYWRSLGDRHYGAVLQHDREGTATDDSYETALSRFNTTFLCRLQPWPQVVPDGYKTRLEARNVFDALWGSSKHFEVTGLMKAWSIVPRLHLIPNEVLVITGDHDYCGGQALTPYLEAGMEARLVTLENAGHLAHLDAEKEYIMHVTAFLGKGSG